MAAPPEPHGNLSSQTRVPTGSPRVDVDASAAASSVPGLSADLDTHALHESLAAPGPVRASRTLDEQDLADLVGAAQRFARRQPWVVVAAAFGVGAMSARWAAPRHGGNPSRAPRRDLPVQSPHPGAAEAGRRGDSPWPTLLAAAGLAYLIYRSHAADSEPAWHEAWRPAYDCDDSQMQPDSPGPADLARRASSLASHAGRTLQDQPLAFALAALAAGLAVGVSAQRPGALHRRQTAGARGEATAAGVR